MIEIKSPKFRTGKILATPGAVAAFGHKGIFSCLARHMAGDWGDVCAEDRAANEAALAHGSRLLSVYNLPEGTLWIITEADRAATTALLPSEY